MIRPSPAPANINTWGEILPGVTVSAVNTRPAASTFGVRSRAVRARSTVSALLLLGVST